MRRHAAILFLLFTAPLSAQTVAPLSVRRINAGDGSVAWLDSQRLLIAGPSGVRTLSLPDGQWGGMIAPAAVPAGLPDPLAVVTDGRSVVASNGFTRSAFACRADNQKRLFARTAPSFVVIDLAVSGETLYVLGWQADALGANNRDGVAVWRGRIGPHFEKFEPLHRIKSGPASVVIFNNSLPIYGGALAAEPDGTLDVITAAEPGVFQYTREGIFRRHLGAQLGELVMRRMHDINVTYSVDAVARYREVVNRQPVIDDLVVTTDGPAIVVRKASGSFVEWELWYPNDNRVERRVKLGIRRLGPFGHLSCDARGRDLACVYQNPATAQAAAEVDQSSVPSFLAQFRLPAPPAAALRTAAQ